MIKCADVGEFRILKALTMLKMLDKEQTINKIRKI